MHIVDYILLFLTAFLSGIFYFFVKLRTSVLKLLLSFSGAYLFCLIAIHLLPELYSTGNPLQTGIFIVLGFVLQIILEFFTEGLEHGHVHLPHHQHHHSKENHIHHRSVNVLPLGIIMGLSIHSFLEGMPLSCNYEGIIHLRINPLLAGILLHNIPIAFTLTNMLVLAGLKKVKAIFGLILFSLMAPLGSLTSWILQNNVISNVEGYNNLVMAIVVGIFLHISTTILFESSANHRFNIIKIATILAGVATAVLLEFL